ncbi:histone-lysine N-methyltransferase SETMAR-like [Euwallacea similis]|uniref:histone-lysine N-methyltransferase SETMAR-like n=1 Tax=Euwallacea similis TaxID=1736056 RepID=UPI00344BAE7A
MLSICDQLPRLDSKIRDIRPALANCKDVVFQHDNFRPHSTPKIRLKLDQLGYEVLSHPPDYSDVVPSDYYLIFSLQNFLDEKKFYTEHDINNVLIKFFHKLGGIHKLPINWRQIINNNRQYVDS